MIDIRNDVQIAPLTTFRIGGSAAYFSEVSTEDELREAFAWAKEHGVPFAILGGGSNVLADDAGFAGLVIKITNQDVRFDDVHVSIDAGRNLLQTIRETAQKGLGGWEKLSGIPGTVGGAARGNAGAFGTEMKDIITNVHAVHAETGDTKGFSNAECDFSYRHSFFKDHPAWIITRVDITLTPGDAAALSASIEETIAEREKRHLQNVRAAGSYFMNPVAPASVVALFEKEKGVKSRENRVPAGWLIEKAGFRGAMLGGARASFQHPNYLVNESGEATAAEVKELADTIKEAVREQFGIELHEEAAFL